MVRPAKKPGKKIPNTSMNTSRRKQSQPMKKRAKPLFLQVQGVRHQCKISKSLWSEIRRLQMSTNNCIPRAPFARLVREKLQEFSKSNEFRVQYDALRALHEATEFYMTELFSVANTCAQHAGRITLFPRDIHLIFQVRGPNDPGRPT